MSLGHKTKVINVQKQSGRRGLYSFTQHISGDYARHTSTDGSHDYLFSLYPGFLLIHVGEDTPNLVGADFPDNERYLGCQHSRPTRKTSNVISGVSSLCIHRVGSSWD